MFTKWRALAAALLMALAFAQQVSVAEAAATPAPGAASGTEDAKVEAVLQGMTLEQKVGQLILATRPSGVDASVSAVKKYFLGGYVLYGTHFKDSTPEKIRAGIEKCQQASPVPMLVAVDEEGGTVTRVSSYKAFRKTRFPSPMNVYKSGGMDAIRKDAQEKAELLTSLGINLNLAPVADVPVSSKDFIYSRSMGTDPALTSEFVKTVVEESSARGLGLALKHFPGYGNNRDTHSGVVVDERPIETFRSRDFLPFIAGVAGGVGSIMVSHNIVKCMDPDKPASLSPAVHQELRDLGFDGVIMTDGLRMRAITREYSAAEAAVLSVQAGNDMLMLNDYAAGIKALMQAVKDGTITEKRVDESVRRILKWKEQLGLL
jgi:beta-N-acetylhexosaminidase